MTPSSPDGSSPDDPRPEHGPQDVPTSPAPSAQESQESQEAQEPPPPAPAAAAPAAAAPDATGGEARGPEGTGLPVLPQAAPAAVPAPDTATSAPTAPGAGDPAGRADDAVADVEADVEPDAAREGADDDEPYDDALDDEPDDDEPDDDEPDEDEDEDEDEPDAAPPGAAGGRLRRALPAVAAALAVVLLTALVVGLGLRLLEQRQLAQVQRPSGPALTAAREAGKVLFSYDYNHLDADFAAALSLTTGSFTGEYRDFTEKVVKPVAVDNEVVVTASVSEAGATGRTTADQLVALVFVDQTTRSTLLTDQAVDRSRVRMTLVKRGSAWKVSKVEAL